MIAKKLQHKREALSASEIVSLDEKVLLQKAQDGDKDAYRLLVEKYQKRAFAISYAITRSYEDAEDVTQEAFVKAFYSLATFKGDSSFYTWLYRIVYNMSIDVKRRHKRRGGNVAYNEVGGGENNAEVASLESHFTASDEVVAQKEEAKRIREVLDTLSPEHRVAIIMRDVDGLSYDEIAKTLKIQTGTVMSRLFYARKMMQKALADIVPVAWLKHSQNSAEKIKKLSDKVNKIKDQNVLSDVGCKN